MEKRRAQWLVRLAVMMLGCCTCAFALDHSLDINQYAVTQDGQKFLVLEPPKGFLESYSVVLNWPAMVK